MAVTIIGSDVGADACCNPRLQRNRRQAAYVVVGVRSTQLALLEYLVAAVGGAGGAGRWPWCLDCFVDARISNDASRLART